MLSAADAEHLATATAIRSPALRLVRDGKPLPLADYADDVPWRPGSFTHSARADRVAAEFAAGATIVLQALQLHWHPAALYCRGLEQRFGFPVQANAYYTPASAQGFAVHHDTHDVFVLQVAGRKRWRVYPPVAELPLKTQRWSTALGDPGEPLHDLMLGPGDTLYLPRGWPHEAFTSDVESLHITVGLHPPTRLDALRAALDAAGDDVEFRRTGAPALELLDRVAERLGPDEVARRARRRFVTSRRPLAGDLLAQVRAAERVTEHPPVERRPTVIADLELHPDAIALVFEGKEVVLPARAATALTALHEAAGPTTAAELPGPLDVPSRVVLVRRLIREGYLISA